MLISIFARKLLLRQSFRSKKSILAYFSCSPLMEKKARSSLDKARGSKSKSSKKLGLARARTFKARVGSKLEKSGLDPSLPLICTRCCHFGIAKNKVVNRPCWWVGCLPSDTDFLIVHWRNLDFSGRFGNVWHCLGLDHKPLLFVDQIVAEIFAARKQKSSILSPDLGH